MVPNEGGFAGGTRLSSIARCGGAQNAEMQSAERTDAGHDLFHAHLIGVFTGHPEERNRLHRFQHIIKHEEDSVNSVFVGAIAQRYRPDQEEEDEEDEEEEEENEEDEDEEEEDEGEDEERRTKNEERRTTTKRSRKMRRTRAGGAGGGAGGGARGRQQRQQQQRRRGGRTRRRTRWGTRPP